jgi:hypothetical protein
MDQSGRESKREGGWVEEEDDDDDDSDEQEWSGKQSFTALHRTNPETVMPLENSRVVRVLFSPCVPF